MSRPSFTHFGFEHSASRQRHAVGFAGLIARIPGTKIATRATGVRKKMENHQEAQAFWCIDRLGAPLSH